MNKIRIRKISSKGELKKVLLEAWDIITQKACEFNTEQAARLLEKQKAVTKYSK